MHVHIVTSKGTMLTWNPAQYLKFADQRNQPCHDLLAHIALDNPRRLIDIGCGPGNSTSAVAKRWSQADITGLDSSTDMIEAARKSSPQIHWQVGDIATWEPSQPYDLIFSNAALHWVPDHVAIYPRLFQYVAAGGALAVQVPANFDAPAQRLMRELAASATWKKQFSAGLREWYVHESSCYYEWLAPIATHLDLWVTEYMHVLSGPEAIVEWYKGTGLRPYLDLLSDSADRERFLSDYRMLIEKEYHRQSDGRVLFPFRRLFLIAYR